MFRKKWQREVARAFDGEAGPHADTPQDLESQAYLKELSALRAGAESAAARENIGDSQFPAFMDGIRERLHAPERGRRGFWTLASLTVAALIVAAATFLVVTGEPAPVAATVVEEATTDIEGASVSWYSTGDGDATVWLSVAGEDVW